MTTNTMTPSATNIPQSEKAQEPAKRPNLPTSATPKSVVAKESSQKDQNSKQSPNAPWWKFWAKSPEKLKAKADKVKAKADAKAEAKASKAMHKSNVVNSSPANFKTPVRRDVSTSNGSNSSGRGGLNGLTPSNATSQVVEHSGDPMLTMLKDLKESNSELNKTLKGISDHLKTSSVRDDRVITALQKVDIAITNADRSFAKSSSAIVASAEKSDKSINLLSKYVSNSTDSFEEVTKRIESNDQENRASLVSLQKRSNRIILSLGVVMIVAAATFSVIHLVMG